MCITISLFSPQGPAIVVVSRPSGTRGQQGAPGIVSVQVSDSVWASSPFVWEWVVIVGVGVCGREWVVMCGSGSGWLCVGVGVGVGGYV